VTEKGSYDAAFDAAQELCGRFLDAADGSDWYLITFAFLLGLEYLIFKSRSIEPPEIRRLSQKEIASHLRRLLATVDGDGSQH
jgi:hypothetical protein